MNNAAKAIIWIIIIVVIILAIWYGVSRKPALISEPEVKKPIKIGAIVPLTGKSASYGQKMRKGIDLAVEDANEKLEKVKIEVIYEDTQGDPTASVSAATKLVKVDRVQGILSILSGVSGAIAPVVQKEGVPLFVFSLASNVTDIGDFIFQPHALASDEGIADADFLMAQGAQRVAILYGSSDSGISMSRSFETTFDGEVVLSEMYTTGNQDFRTFLVKIKEANPDWLYLPGYDIEVARILKQSREVDFNVPVLSVQGVNSQALLDIAGQLAEGLIYSTAVLDPDESDPAIADIFKRYKERYGEEVNIYGGEAYDAVMLFAEVVKDGVEDTEIIRDRIAATQGFKGVSGTITFDEKRHVAKKFGYFTVKNGQFVPYEE